MGYTRKTVQESVQRAGEDHWQALIDHHEHAYPESRPTPGDVCRGEADRLNELGMGDAKEFELLETRAERLGSQVRITHLLLYKPLGMRLLTEPFTGYG